MVTELRRVEADKPNALAARVDGVAVHNVARQRHTCLFKALIGYAVPMGRSLSYELEPSEGVEPPSSTNEVDALPLSYLGNTG
jgi:hypothetical protein